MRYLPTNVTSVLVFGGFTSLASLVSFLQQTTDNTIILAFVGIFTTLASVVALLVKFVIKINKSADERNQREITQSQEYSKNITDILADNTRVTEEHYKNLSDLVVISNRTMDGVKMSLDLHTKAIERQIDATDKLKDIVTFTISQVTK
jgi:hypothetical protein